LLQKKLLETEGVSVVEFRVDLKRHLWRPAKIRKRRAADLRTRRRK
jgi:hypothetical protein